MAKAAAKSQSFELAPITDAEYQKWVSGSCYPVLTYGHPILTYTCWICGYAKPAEPEKYVALRDSIEQRCPDVEKKLVNTYHLLKTEVIKGGNYKDPLDISPSKEEIEEAAQRANLTLPEQYYQFKAERENYNKKLHTDPLFLTNEEIKLHGQDVDEALFSLSSWDIVTARDVLLGRSQAVKNQRINGVIEEDWQWYLAKKNYYVPTPQRGVFDSVHVAKDYAFNVIEGAGYKKESWLINPHESDPAKWKITPASFIAWCASHGFYPHPQLLKKREEGIARGNLKPMKLVSSDGSPLKSRGRNGKGKESLKTLWNDRVDKHTVLPCWKSEVEALEGLLITMRTPLKKQSIQASGYLTRDRHSRRQKFEI